MQITPDQSRSAQAALEYIVQKCEQVAENELHAEVAIFAIYTSALQALKGRDDDVVIELLDMLDTAPCYYYGEEVARMLE